MLHLSITRKVGNQPHEHTVGAVEGRERWRPSSHREDAGGQTATKGPHWLKKNLIFKHQALASSTWGRLGDGGSFFWTLCTRVTPAEIESFVFLSFFRSLFLVLTHSRGWAAILQGKLCPDPKRCCHDHPDKGQMWAYHSGYLRTEADRMERRRLSVTVLGGTRGPAAAFRQFQTGFQIHSTNP